LRQRYELVRTAGQIRRYTRPKGDLDACHVEPHVAGAALAELAARVAAIDYDALDVAARTMTRQRLFDALGAAALGHRTPEGRVLVEHAARARTAALADGTACRLHVGAARTTEIDDIDLPGCTTVGAVVVPVAVTAAAAQPGANDRPLLAAVAAGYEAMTRLGRTIGGATLLHRGVWPTYVTAAFGASAATSRLLELDAAVTARALALALARSAALPAAALARFGYRYYALGCAAVDGRDAALAAAAGVDADLAGLAPFAERLGAPLDLRELAADFGAPWAVTSVDSKPWPTSRQALASVLAFRSAAAPPPDDIERIVARVPPAYRAMIDRPAMPANRIESMLSVQYQIALAALAPATLDDAVRSGLPRDARIAALMQKVRVIPDESLGTAFPRAWGSRVTIELRAGGTLEAEALAAPHSNARPLVWHELAAKHERVFAASGVSVGGRLGALASVCERVGEGAACGAAPALLAMTEELASA
jgi:2-methylcitrate dehydratase PrpD